MPTNDAPYATLANYFDQHPLGSGANLGLAARDVAKFIVLNANPIAAAPPANPNDPTVMSRIFDILSRPNYAVANVVKDSLNSKGGNFDPLASAMSGLAGTQKTTFQDVLKGAGMPDNNLRAMLGLGLDIGLDPTTYIPGGQLKNATKIFKGAKEGEQLAKDLPLGQKLLNAGEPINPENFGLPAKEAAAVPDALKAQVHPEITALPDPAALGPKTGFTTPNPLLDLPGIESITGSARKITIPDSIRAKIEGAVSPAVGKELKGQTAMKFPDFNVKKIQEAAKVAKVDKAHQIVQGLADGNIEDALKMVPGPTPAIKPIHSAIADSIVGKFPNTATAAINKLDPATLNAQQQVKLWYKAREFAADRVYTKGRSKASVEKDIQQQTAAIYKSVENKFVNLGRVPRIGTGENVKLSEVISDLTARGVPVTDQVLHEFGHQIKMGSELSGAVERARARGAITDAIPTKQITDAVGTSKAQLKASGALSNAETFNADKFLKQFAKYSAKQAKISPAGIKATDKLVNMTLDAGKSSAAITTQRMAKQLDEVVAKGKTNLDVNRAITVALSKDLGKMPAWVVNDNKAMEWIMSRVSTSWGQEDLRPLSLNAIASAQATAEARGKALGNMFKGFDLTQRAEAFRLAQGIGRPSTPQSAYLAQEISRMMSDLVGKVSGSSVLLKSGVQREMLNKWMKRYGTNFEFTKGGKIKDPVTGEIHDFSQGTNWLDSWKVAELKQKDPAEFMFKTMQALEQSTREKALFDDLGERFGSSMFGKSYTTKISGHPYLDGYFFPKDIAKQIPRLIRDWSIGTGSSNNMIRVYDKVLSMWKTLATIYRPAHHIRNLIGDVYMGMLDGVVSVKPYRLALKVQRSMKGAYETMSDIDRLVEIGAVSRTARTPLPGELLFTNKSGVKFTAEQIAAVAHQKGLLESVKTLEDIIDLGKGGHGFSLASPLGGHAQKLARGASELESHNTRLAHFIDVIMKSRGSDLPTIFENAAQRTRKFHPSGLDLTHFEKTVLRRVLPFYSWIRKSTPVLLEGMVMRPGISVIPAKVNEAIQQANGIDVSRDNPFPVDQMFPNWIRDEGIGPVSLPNGWLGGVSNQSPPGYTQAGVGLNPLSQIVQQLQNPGKTLISSLTPGLLIPLELSLGQKTFTGQQITGPMAKPGALQQYIGEQIPMYSAVQGMTGMTPFGTTTKASLQSGNQSGTEDLMNWLTGLGIKGTGPDIRSAKTEKSLPIKTARNATKQDYLAQLRQQIGM